MDHICKLCGSHVAKSILPIHMENHAKIPECLRDMVNVTQNYLSCSACELSDFGSRHRTVDLIISHIVSDHLQPCEFSCRWLDRFPSCTWCGEYSYGVIHEDVVRNNSEHLEHCHMEQQAVLDYFHANGYYLCLEHSLITTDLKVFEKHLRLHYLTSLDFQFTRTTGDISPDYVKCMCCRCNYIVQDEDDAEEHLIQHLHVPKCLGIHIEYKKNYVICNDCQNRFPSSKDFMKHFGQVHLTPPIHIDGICTWCKKRKFDSQLLDAHYWSCASSYEIVTQFYVNQDRIDATLIGNKLSKNSPLALIDEFILRDIMTLIK